MKYIYSVMITGGILMSSLPVNSLAAEIKEPGEMSETAEQEQPEEPETDQGPETEDMKEPETVAETETSQPEEPDGQQEKQEEKPEKKNRRDKIKETAETEEDGKEDPHHNDTVPEDTAAEPANEIVALPPFVLNQTIKQTLSEYFSDKVMVKVSAASFLNMREQPDTASKTLARLKAGEIAELAEKASEGDSKSAFENSSSDDGKWVKIIHGGREGYINTGYVLTGLEAQDIAIAGEKMMAVMKPGENDTLEEGEAEIKKEGPLTVTSIVDGQVAVVNSEGEKEIYEYDLFDYEVAPVEAEMLGEYEKKAETYFTGMSMVSGKRGEIVNFALQYTGGPYVWGGTSLTGGADCSGFIQSVLGQFGIGVPRVACDQYAASAKVSMEGLQPGDLVFYTDGTEIGHVALYIGEGQIVHARNSALGIRVDPVNYGSAIAGYGTYIQ